MRKTMSWKKSDQIPTLTGGSWCVLPSDAEKRTWDLICNTVENHLVVSGKSPPPSSSPWFPHLWNAEVGGNDLNSLPGLKGRFVNAFPLHALRVPSLETLAPTWASGSGLVVGGSSTCQQASLSSLAEDQHLSSSPGPERTQLQRAAKGLTQPHPDPGGAEVRTLLAVWWPPEGETCHQAGTQFLCF